MGYRRFLCSIFLVVLFVNVSTAQRGDDDEADAFRKQLIAEASDFNLKIDECQIRTTESKGEGNDGTVVYVPLLDKADTTDDEIKKGGVDVGFQCMATENLKGCFKVKLTGANEKEASFALVDKEGKTVATSTIQVGAQRARPCIHVWINGVYMGCFDRVIIIIVRAE